MIKLDFLLAGAFDPIIPLADICEKYNMWLHVDVSGHPKADSTITRKRVWSSLSNARFFFSTFIGRLGRWSPALQQEKAQTGRHWESAIRDLESAQADVHLAAVLYRAFPRERRISFKFRIRYIPFKSNYTFLWYWFTESDLVLTERKSESGLIIILNQTKFT